MFGNTLVLPHSGGDVTMVKINQDGYSSEYLYRGALSQYRAKIRHTKTKATATRPSYDRHNVEVVETIFEAGDEAEYERKVYIVFETLPEDGDVENIDALADWAIATANSNLDSLVGWES